MSNNQVGTIYQQIIQDVIDSSRVDFEEGGIDEGVLEELKKVSASVFHCRSLVLLPPALGSDVSSSALSRTRSPARDMRCASAARECGSVDSFQRAPAPVLQRACASGDWESCLGLLFSRGALVFERGRRGADCQYLGRPFYAPRPLSAGPMSHPLGPARF